MIQNTIIPSILTVTICSLLVGSCSKTTSAGAKHTDDINENFRYQLSKYQFGTLNKYIANNLTQINSKNLIDYYYEKMKLSYAAYTVAVALQKFEYNKNFGELEPGLVPTDELGATLLVFLLSGYLEAGDIQSYLTVRKKRAITTNNPLYNRFLVMNSIASGKKQVPIIQEYPQIAYRYQFGEIPSTDFVIKKRPEGRSLDDLDQMILALKTGNDRILDSVFHEGAQTPLYYLQYFSPKGLSVDIYDPRSLWLSFMYYGDKLLALCEYSEDVSPAYSNYLTAMTYFFRGNKEKALLNLNDIIHSEQSISSSLKDISNAIYLGIIDVDSTVPVVRIQNLKTNIEKVKYCESLYRFSPSKHCEVINNTFREILTRDYPPVNSLEGVYYSLTESDTLCNDLEILYTIARYYLMINQIKEAEKCLLAIYQVYKSFSIKDNVNCGNLYEYDPALFVIYSSSAMLNNNNMISIVLQEITALSMGERIFLIPSRILSNILTPPKIYGDNKLE